MKTCRMSLQGVRGDTARLNLGAAVRACSSNIRTLHRQHGVGRVDPACL